jgi:hypothetical protein
MKKILMGLLFLVVGISIVIGTAHAPKPDPAKIAERRAASEAEEAAHQKLVDFCIGESKPFSTSVSYEQDEATQRHNGFAACMREKGDLNYKDAPLPKN